MNISRITSTRIMSKALQQQQSCLLGLIEPSGSIYICQNGEEMETRMREQNITAIFYNQHPDAMQFIESHPLADGRISIEIFQDIEGVFGLRAYQMNDRIQQPIDLTFEEGLA
jgi:hypothetical protein